MDGTEATFRMAADDLCVRARIEANTPSGFTRYFHPGVQVARTQPYGAA